MGGRSRNGGARNGGGDGNNGNASGSSSAISSSSTPPAPPLPPPQSRQGSSSSPRPLARPPPPPSPPRGAFAVDLPAPFLLLSFLASAAAAFLVGWVARLALLSHVGLTPYDATATGGGGGGDAGGAGSDPPRFPALPATGGMSQKKLAPVVAGGGSGKRPAGAGAGQLPSPRVLEGKDVPFTTYASRTFQMAGAATSHTLHIDRTGAGAGASGKGMMMMSPSRLEFDGGPDLSLSGGNGNDEADAGADDAGADDGAEGEGRDGDGDGDGWVPLPCDEKACSRGKEKKEPVITPGDEHNDDSDDLHLPAGQHLLVDIKDVDPNFLNSEERLASAMIELCDATRLTLLSYHCHTLVPVGVSCAGVLLESHVAFHTWPLEGVITLDLFTCGGGLLVPTLPFIEELFMIPSEEPLGSGDREADGPPPKPTMLWSHVLRGFREGFAPGYVRSKNPLDGSLGRYVLGKLDFDAKAPLLSTKTAVQSVNIYEVLDPQSRDVSSYRKSVDADLDTYEAQHPALFGPDKMLFLDGILQSSLYGDAPYHESIVHPAMTVHDRPRRVAIIGGGEGAALREVLKHKSVEEVVILEIDEELVHICAEYMPEWSDCRDVEGGDAASCFDDSRARLIHVDAFKWFVDRFGGREGGNEEAEAEEKFDVIVMDALDPNTSVEIAGGLYNDTSFLDALFRGLTDEGVFSVQLGKSKMSADPADDIGRFRDEALMIQGLEQSGFRSIHTYDEAHSRFYMPWSYLVAFKAYKTRAAWYRDGPEIDIELRRRIQKTKSGRPALRYFDAATMLRYQFPSKATEITYCRRGRLPYECDELRGFYEDDAVLPASDYLHVTKSKYGGQTGRGIFAATDIPKDALLAVDEHVKAFHFLPLTWSAISKMDAWSNAIIDEFPFVHGAFSHLSTFMKDNGWGDLFLGEEAYAVDSGPLLFINHGCNGTHNYGEGKGGITEFNIDLNNPKGISDNLVTAEESYSPVFERRWRIYLNCGDYALHDIKEGEEILANKIRMLGNPDDLKKEVMSLRKLCSEKAV